MTINHRFSANLISSAKLNPALVPGLKTAGAGDDIVKAGLSQIADATQISVAKAAESSDHARPSMLASLSSFAKNVGDALKAVAPGAAVPFGSLNSIAQQDFAEWQGMIAAVALSNVYSGAGLKLSVSPVTLSEVGNVVHKCILLEMHKDSVYGDAVTTTVNGTMEGSLYYICQDGRPFAVFHPAIGLCAMKNYDTSLFDGILPWYENKGDCHGNWKMVMDPATADSLLDDFCLRRIQWWANQNGMLNYAAFVGSHLSPDGAGVVLNAGLVSASLMPNAVNINSTWQGKGTVFGTSMAFYMDGAGITQGLPELFNDNMLLTSMATPSDNHLIYNTPAGEKPICFANQLTELQNVAPVAPFRSEFAGLLEACKLEELDFQAEVLCERLCGVTVQAALRNSQGEVFHIGKCYDSGHLKLGKLPYMMIWPYIPLPDGMNLWKDFYASWHDQTGAISMVKKEDGDFLPMAADLTFDFGSQGAAHSICRVTAATKPWTVCKSAAPFRYAQVKEMVNGIPQNSWGMIFLPEYESYNPNAAGIGVLHAGGGPAAIQLAVDFGTTSTVCALKTTLLNNGNVLPLPYRDYGRIVTCNEDHAKKIVDEQHWLGMGNTDKTLNWNQKIFSVAQLFGKGAGFAMGGVVAAATQKYYIDGRMFLISGEAMVNYASAGNQTDENQTVDPLLNQQIMSDMKFNEKLDVQNTLAASIYLAGVYMHAVLYLLSQKVIPVGKDIPYLELRASYPNDVTLGALKTNWNNAYGILSGMMASDLIAPIPGLLAGHEAPDGTLVSQFFSEATATTAYLHSATNPTAVAGAKNLVSLDIGGGTTDISITSVNYPQTVRKLSFRYAGREIVVASLIEFFRKFHEKTVIGSRETAFQQIWPNPGNTIINQFLELTQFADGGATPHALQTLTDNSSIQMDIELLLSEGMNLGGIPTQMQNNQLRQLMALKFLMIMRIVARMVKENLDIWINPITDQLDTTNGILNIDLAVSGTSAQALQYIFDTSLTGLQSLLGAPAGQMLQMKQLLEAMLDEELTGQVPDGVKTNLRIYVNPDVREKREVCYGMLDPDIQKYVITDVGKKFELDAMALNTTMADADRQKKVADTNKMLINYHPDKLREYLNGETNADGKKKGYGLLDFARAYENIFFANAPKGNLPISGINTISELLLDYTKSFGAAQMNVANKKTPYMVEPEQEPYRDLLACTYLVEEILNSEIAKRQ